MWNFLRNCHTIFQSGCTILHACRHYTSVSVSPLISTYFQFFSNSHPHGYEMVPYVLICFSPAVSDAEHLFTCLLPTWMSSSDKCLFESCIHFWIFFCCWVLGILYISWILIPDQIRDLQIFSPILWVAFHSVVLWCTKVFYLIKSSLPIFFFSFVSYAFGVTSKKSLSNPVSWSFPLMFSCRSFIVLTLRFRPLIHST